MRGKMSVWQAACCVSLVYFCLPMSTKVCGLVQPTSTVKMDANGLESRKSMSLMNELYARNQGEIRVPLSLPGHRILERRNAQGPESRCARRDGVVMGASDRVRGGDQKIGFTMPWGSLYGTGFGVRFLLPSLLHHLELLYPPLTSSLSWFPLSFPPPHRLSPSTTVGDNSIAYRSRSSSARLLHRDHRHRSFYCWDWLVCLLRCRGSR
jgi:hypothetical protein